MKQGIADTVKTDENLINTNIAMQIIKEKCNMSVTRKTVLLWIIRYKMGRKVGGRWVVYKDALISLLEGNKNVSNKGSKKVSKAKR